MAELAIMVGVIALLFYVATGPRVIRTGIDGLEVLAGKKDDMDNPEAAPGCGEVVGWFAMAAGLGLFLLFLVAGGGS